MSDEGFTDVVCSACSHTFGQHIWANPKNSWAVKLGKCSVPDCECLLWVRREREDKLR